jgi:hypothetical protein
VQWQRAQLDDTCFLEHTLSQLSDACELCVSVITPVCVDVCVR